MNASKSEMYIMSHSQFFPPEKMVLVRERLDMVPEDKFSILYSLELKNPTNILLFSIFLGEFGVDRFMLGDTGLGIGKLLTLGGCLVWWLIDLFYVRDRARQVNYEKLMSLIEQAR